MIKTYCVMLFSMICAIVTITMDYKHEKENNEQIMAVNTIKLEEVVEKNEPEEIVEYISMWTIENTNIKKEPSVDSETVGKYNWNEEAVVTYVNDDWAKIQDTECYIERKFLCEYQVGHNDYDVPNNSGMKSYMDYRTITSVESNQYKLQQIASTDESGIRKVNDRYCIAVGSYYSTTIGQYIDVELENGEVIHGILADCKDDKHTDSKNQIHAIDGSVVEFVVDTNSLGAITMKMGDISYINNWNSKVINIRIYDKIADF